MSNLSDDEKKYFEYINKSRKKAFNKLRNKIYDVLKKDQEKMKEFKIYIKKQYGINLNKKESTNE